MTRTIAEGKSLSALPVYSASKLSDPATQALARGLRDNHAMYAPLRDPSLIFHNHMPHILGSSYYLGADSDKLAEIYKHEGAELRPNPTVPVQDATTVDKWRDNLTQKNYTLAFMKFFDDQIEKAGGDWHKVANEYLYSSDKPLINGYVGGLGHPFIHLAYAYEFDSKEVASEALSLGCTEYDHVHQYFDSPPPDTSTYKSKSFEDIIARVREDKRFSGHFDEPGFLNTFTIHAKCEDALLEHWNALVYHDLDQQFEEIFDFAVRISIEGANRETKYDFFLIHLLTTAHAIRVIFPFAPKDRRDDIFKQFWMWMIVMYVCQLSRPIDKGSIDEVDLAGRDWDWVRNKALTGELSLDAHYVKVIRALKVGAEIWGEKGGWYLKAAVKFIDEFTEWTGFGQGVGSLE